MFGTISQTIGKFNSTDTEGSDLSYDSSSEEQQGAPQTDKQDDDILISRNVGVFKEQMQRFLLSRPELGEEIKF